MGKCLLVLQQFTRMQLSFFAIWQVAMDEILQVGFHQGLKAELLTELVHINNQNSLDKLSEILLFNILLLQELMIICISSRWYCSIL